MYVLALPTWRRLAGRMLKQFIAAPKIFFAAFAWEGFGLIATEVSLLTTSSAGYFLMTGVGATIGYFISHLIIMHLMCITPRTTEYYGEMHTGLLLAIASGLFAGTLWGVWVWTGSAFLGTTFTGMFFYMFAATFLVFYAALCFLRVLNSVLPSQLRMVLGDVDQLWRFDLTLSISVAAADAFFVATSSSLFPGSWLVVFDVTSETPVGIALSFSGVSSMIGFLIAQSLQNLVFEYTWLDDAWTMQENVCFSSCKDSASAAPPPASSVEA